MSQYAKGSLAWGLCQICGLRFLLRELVMDGQIPWLRVCTECRSPKQPQERLISVSDPQTLWRPSPELGGPSAPVLSSDLVSDDVTLTWTASTVGDSIITAYRVMRADNGGDAALLDTLEVERDEYGAITSQPLTYVDNNLAAGSYVYRVDAVDAFGRTASSNTQSESV